MELPEDSEQEARHRGSVSPAGGTPAPGDPEGQKPGVVFQLPGSAPPLAAVSNRFEMEKRKGRGSVRIVQTPSAENGFTLVVDWNDERSDSCNWYEVVVSWEGEPDLLIIGPSAGGTQNPKDAMSDD